MVDAVGGDQRMHISVAICTWNRAPLLDKTLAAMRALTIPVDIFWELIIVDNNCTDNTEKIIEKHCKDLPIVLISEPKQGLSNARNAAVVAAKGKYIIWTDDDVLVDESWLSAYVEAFRKHPEACFFGGPVDPWFEATPPLWVLESWNVISDAFAARDLGSEPFLFDIDRLPYGANFAIRMKEQKDHLFDPNLGLVKGKIILGEETFLMKRLLQEGGVGWWVPSARVRHWISRSRLRLKYIRDYFFGYGRTLSRRTNAKPLAWHQKPRWLWRKAFQAEFMYRWTRIVCSSGIWVKHLKEASTYWGMIFENY